MALQPLALHLLGVETTSQERRNSERRRQDDDGVSESRPPRAASRRATSYYNAFTTHCTPIQEDPPSYGASLKKRPEITRRHIDGGKESLPMYSCTVAAEGKVLFNIESVSPLHGVAASEWREIYFVLRGTLLSFHKAKDNGPGRLLRSYTLQHAEVGLAADIEYSVLEPRTKLGHLIPSAARRRAYLKDPDLFDVVPQYAMRLRVETDQIVLASACEEQIHNLIHAVAAGIDVSYDIAERHEPRQITVPRRRRRHRTQQPANLNDPAFLAEQERLLREMYPGFAGGSNEQPGLELGRPVTTVTAGSALEPNDPLPTSTREEEEIDLSMIREEEEVAPPPSPSPLPSRLRPNFMRSITDTSIATTFTFPAGVDSVLYAASPDNFHSDTGKWQPPHTRTQEQIRRYGKRCLPTLPPEAARASEILICNGKRVRVNLRTEMLEAWELQPPSYKSHGFAKVAEQGRPLSVGQESVEAPNAEAAQTSSTSQLDVENGNEDIQITPAAGADDEGAIAGLTELAKVTSLSTPADKPPSREAARAAKRAENRDAALAGDMNGVVVCF